MSYVFNMVGGGSSGIAYIGVTYPAGSVCTATQGGTILTAENTNGSYVFCVPSIGNWVISSTDGSSTATKTVSITAQGRLAQVSLNYGVPTDIYQKVSYLRGTGTQYLKMPNTVTVNKVRSGSLVFAYDGWNGDGDRGIMGGTSDSSFYVASAGFKVYASNNMGISISYAGKNSHMSSGINSSSARTFNFYLASGNQSYTIVNKETVTNNSTKTPSASPFYLYEVCMSNSKTCGAPAKTMNVYSFTLRDANNNLLVDLYPCYQKSNNVPGMWDNVSKTFLTNSGSGTFGLGPNIS